MRANTKKTILLMGVTLSLIIPTRAALLWDQISFTNTGGGTVQNTDITNVPVWPITPGAAVFPRNLVVDNSTQIEGLAITNPGNINQFGGVTVSSDPQFWDAGIDGTMNFSFTVNGGGTADLFMSAVGGSAVTSDDVGYGDWFRFELVTSGNVTSIDYEITYNNAIQGYSDDPNGGFVLIGLRGSSSTATTLGVSLLDENLNTQNITASTASNRPVNDSTLGNIVLQTDFNDGTTAGANLAANENGGLGILNVDGAFTGDKVGGFTGSYASTSGGSLGEGSVFVFSLNGDFTNTVVIPEPASTSLLALSSLALLFRRTRKKQI